MFGTNTNYKEYKVQQGDTIESIADANGINSTALLMVNEDIYNIVTDVKKSVIMVTHDISEAIAFSDRVITLTRRPATIKNVYDINFDELKQKGIKCLMFDLDSTVMMSKSDLVAQAGLDQLDCMLQHFSLIGAFALNFNFGAALDAGAHHLHDALGIDLLLTVDDGDIALEVCHFLDKHTGRTGMQTLLVNDGYFFGYHRITPSQL